MTEKLDPGLYVVATPIGNLGDLTPRAADVLCRADLILAEDTRVTGKLLAHVGSKRPAQRFDDHAEGRDLGAIVTRLGAEAVALVSDAGTPLISDPGYKLVRAAREAGREVRAVPGPSAAIAALSIAGLPSDRFLFAGFLPAKAKARDDAIAGLADVAATLVLYESGPRLADCLVALSERLGDRDAVVARELTKLHEECLFGTLADLAARYASAPAPRGEIVLIIGPPPPPAEVADDALDAALDAALERLSPSRAAAQVAEQLKVPRKRAYARALERMR